MEPDELEELIALHREELTEEELVVIIKVSKEELEEQGSEDEEDLVRPNLTVKFQAEVLQDMRAVADGFKVPTQ